MFAAWLLPEFVLSLNLLIVEAAVPHFCTSLTMNLTGLFVFCLAYASHGNRVKSIPRRESSSSSPVSLEALSALLKTAKPDAGWQVAGTSLRPGSALKRPTLNSARHTAAVTMQEEATLEEQLKEGLITQEEYDMLSEAVDESEYLAELEKEPEEKKLSKEAADEKSRLSGPTGVEFAPWMKIDPEAIAQAKKDRAARLERLEKERQETDSFRIKMMGDVRDKVLSEEEVELRWQTTDEADNNGFLVQRRKARSDSWETLASYENTPSLRSKGTEGGIYVYLDDDAGKATWVYRIVGENKVGRTVVSQKLVEIESQEELFADYAWIAGLVIAFAGAWFAVSNIDGDVLA